MEGVGYEGGSGGSEWWEECMGSSGSRSGGWWGGSEPDIYLDVTTCMGGPKYLNTIR